MKDYKGQIALYSIASILAVVFSLLALTMLGPVLQVLFNEGQQQTHSSATSIFGFINTHIQSIIAQNGKLTALAYVCITVVIFIFLKNLFLYIAIYILNPIRNAVLRRLRNDLFSKTLSLPISFFTEERKGDLISRMTNDINEVEWSVVSVLEVFIREPVTIICFLTSMIIMSPQLTIFLVIFLPISGLIIGRISRSLRKSSNLAQEQLGLMMGTIDETLVGMRVIKAFNAEKHQHLRFMNINNLLFRTKNKIAARKEIASPLSETMGVIVVAIILWYGGRLVLGKVQGFEASWFLTYIAVFTQLINPFKSLSAAFSNVQKGSAALARIEQLLNVDNTVKEIPNAKPIKSFEEKIEFRNVHFAYGERKILDGIDLVIGKGKMIALVGASGAGKSTLVDLIPRFHDVTSGEILIDGLNVKECRLDDLRRLMGVVSQEPILFNDSIYNNITLGTGGTTQEQVEEAAKIAHAHNFILQKSEGYQTNVGDRGNKLSGGERQRVTIARAVLKNPPILILDEATSSLDTESERIVQEAINTLMQNRTCIVIAHRLSTVQHADEIIVLERGKIVERGNHTGLLNKDGKYKRLVEMQQVK
jgi:subfamily B ATP-binding cassette protein MsbA